MLLKGKIEKAVEGGLLISIPLLNVMTQGETKKEAFEMLSDYLLSFLEYPEGLNFDVLNFDEERGEFYLKPSDHRKVLPFILQRLRQISTLSLAEAKDKLNLKSRNAYARYENAECDPTFTKLEELLSITGCDLVLEKVATK